MKKNKLVLGAIIFFFTVSIRLYGQKDYESPVFAKEKPKKEKIEKKEKKPRPIGYRGHFEAGAVVKVNPLANVQFGGGFTSHGIYYRNVFLGPGVGIDLMDSLSFLPIVADLRFTVSSPAVDGKPVGDGKRKSDFFIFFQAGESRLRSQPNIFQPKGIVFQGGMGFIMGNQRDTRATLTFGYKYQEHKLLAPAIERIKIESVHVRLGVQFKS